MSRRPSPVLIALLVAGALAAGCSVTPGYTTTTAAAAAAHPMLGSNVANREPVERSMLAKTLLYLPDRLLDLGDIISFDVHVGIGALVNVHLTRAIQSGAGMREVLGFGWHTRRSLGFQNQGDVNFFMPFVGMEAAHVGQVGTSGIDSASDGSIGIIGPSDPLYQEYRDYWAVGAQATVGIVGVDFDFHPVQFVDFLLGWVTIDFLNDDFARTRGIDEDALPAHDVVSGGDHDCSDPHCSGLTCKDLVTVVVE